MEQKQNFLIPSHRKLTEEEVQEILEKYALNSNSKLPKIKIKDPALSEVEDLAIGDVIEITRKSFVGQSKYYRVVIE